MTDSRGSTAGAWGLAGAWDGAGGAAVVAWTPACAAVVAWTPACAAVVAGAAEGAGVGLGEVGLTAAAAAAASWFERGSRMGQVGAKQGAY